MDQRLLRKLEPIERYAHLNGWDTERVQSVFDGCDGVQIVGSRTDGHPEAAHGVDFGFSVAFAINPQTNRVQAMRFDGKPNAVFVMVVEDGTGRYWHGPLSAHERALADPVAWTGVEVPVPDAQLSR